MKSIIQFLNESAESRQVIDKFKPVVREIEVNTDDGLVWKITLGDENSKLEMMMNIHLDGEAGRQELVSEWDKTIFNLSNADESLQREVQDDDNIYHKCEAECAEYLYQERYIKKNSAGYPEPVENKK